MNDWHKWHFEHAGFLYFYCIYMCICMFLKNIYINIFYYSQKFVPLVKCKSKMALFSVWPCSTRSDEWSQSVCESVGLHASPASCLGVMGVKQIGIKSLMKSAETQICVCACVRVWSAVIITSCLGIGGDLLFCTALCDKTAASPGTLSLIMKGNKHFEEWPLIFWLTGIDVIK